MRHSHTYFSIKINLCRLSSKERICFYWTTKKILLSFLHSIHWIWWWLSSKIVSHTLKYPKDWQDTLIYYVSHLLSNWENKVKPVKLYPRSASLPVTRIKASEWEWKRDRKRNQAWFLEIASGIMLMTETETMTWEPKMKREEGLNDWIRNVLLKRHSILKNLHPRVSPKSLESWQHDFWYSSFLEVVSRLLEICWVLMRPSHLLLINIAS
jgi:hypothetical protein